MNFRNRYTQVNADFISEMKELDKAMELKEQLLKSNQEYLDKDKIYEETTTLFENIATEQRQSIKERVEEMVTSALQFIMEEDIGFIIKYTEGARNISTQFYVQTFRGSIPITTKVEFSRGDGIGDIVSIALRIAQKLLIEENKAPMIFDEPAKQVSEKYLRNIALFLKEISETFDLQIIMITHLPILATMADKKFLVESVESVSEVKEVDDSEVEELLDKMYKDSILSN